MEWLCEHVVNASGHGPSLDETESEHESEASDGDSSDGIDCAAIADVFESVGVHPPVDPVVEIDDD